LYTFFKNNNCLVFLRFTFKCNRKLWKTT